jgi:hypothetical protein
MVGLPQAREARGLKAQPCKCGTRQIVIANGDRLAALIIGTPDVDTQPDRYIAVIWIDDVCSHGAISRQCRAESQPLGIGAIECCRHHLRIDQGRWQAEQSARMPGVLCWARALPSLRSLLSQRSRTTIDDQAVAFPLALVAYGAMPQSRTTAGLAGCREFFMHFVSLHLSGKQPGPPVIVPARDWLPKNLSRQEGRETAGASTGNYDAAFFVITPTMMGPHRVRRTLATA